VEFAGDLMADMNIRRGRISGTEIVGSGIMDSDQILKAEAPMSEMLTNQNDLTSITQGRASFHRSSPSTTTERPYRRTRSSPPPNRHGRYGGAFRLKGMGLRHPTADAAG